MIENVTIVDKNGNGILVEGLMHISVDNNGTNTEYVFYTLNEMVDADQTKIYIAETTSEVGKAGPIEDEEWKNLKNTMIQIAQNKDVTGISYLPLTGTTFNISDPRKLAVKLNIKQALKNAQQTHMLSGIQDPVVGGSSVGTFFDQSVMNVPEPVEQTTTETQVNIFNTPPQPIYTEQPTDNNQVVGGEAVAAPAVAEQVAMPAPETLAAPAVQTQLVDTGVEAQNTIIETPVNPIGGNLPEVVDSTKLVAEPVIGTAATEVDDNVLADEPTLLPPKEEIGGEVIGSESKTETTGEKKVTRDDAIQAMVTIIEYLDMKQDLTEQFKTSLVNNITGNSGVMAEATAPAEPEKVEATTTEVVPNVVVNMVTQPVVETQPEVVGAPTMVETPTVVEPPVPEETIQQPAPMSTMATPIIEESPIMGIINSANNMAAPIIETPIITPVAPAPEVVVEAPVQQSVEQPVVAAPVAEVPAAVPTIETPEFQNPMSYEASKSEAVNNSPIANIIDTSVQGIQAAAPAAQAEEQINPGLIPVQFESPVVPEVPNNTGTIQPTTPPPVDNYIPDVTPTNTEPAEYVHTAQNNNGKAPIQAEVVNQIEGPEVVMPDNAKNVQMATQGMQGQGMLGPSGLVADPKQLNLVA